MYDDWSSMFSFSGPNTQNLMQGSNRTMANPSGLLSDTTQQNAGGLFSGMSNFGISDAIGLGGLYLQNQGLNNAKDAFDFEKSIKNQQLQMLKEDRNYNKGVRENLRNIRF